MNYPGFTITGANPREIIHIPNYDGENAYYGAERLIYDVERYVEDIERNLQKRKTWVSMTPKMSKKITKKLRKSITRKTSRIKQQTEEEIDDLIRYMQDIDDFYHEIESLEYEPEDFANPMDYHKKRRLQQNMLKTLSDLKTKVDDIISSMISLTGGKSRRRRKHVK